MPRLLLGTGFITLVILLSHAFAPTGLWILYVGALAYWVYLQSSSTLYFSELNMANSHSRRRNRGHRPNWTRPSVDRSPRSGAKTGRQLLYWLAVCVAIIVAIANMIPYIKAANYVLLNVFEFPFLIRFFANNAMKLVAIPVGILVWGFIQTAETYPILLRHDRRVMRLIATEAESSDRLSIRGDEDRALLRLKQWYNNFPLLAMRSANRTMLFAYVVDTAICISVFPPVEGGFERLVFVIFTGQWGLIDWGAVALIIVMLFCFEAMVRLVLFLGLQAFYFTRAHR